MRHESKYCIFSSPPFSSQCSDACNCFQPLIVLILFFVVQGVCVCVCLWWCIFFGVDTIIDIYFSTTPVIYIYISLSFLEFIYIFFHPFLLHPPIIDIIIIIMVVEIHLVLLVEFEVFPNVSKLQL